MKTTAKPLVFPLSLLGAAAALSSGALADTNNNPTRHFRSPPLYNHHSSTPVTWSETAGSGGVSEDAPRTSEGPDGALFPPEAKPGECWARVLVPPPVETRSEQVLVKEESFDIVEIPAEMETVEEQVVVRPERERQEIIPATFKEVEEQVVKRAAYTRKVPVPAEYETVTERVLVRPERSYWKEGRGPLEKVDHMTGEIMCYVTEPAVYETVSRRVLKSPATVREEEVPAEYETITRTVVDQPAQIRTIVEPAEYRTVEVERVKTPARTERRPIPAEYASLERQISQGQSRMEWRRILCETNVTAEVIGDVQEKLNDEGFNAGEVDGEYDQTTARALAEYQDAKGLPQAGLTYETLLALNVPLN